MRRSVGFIADVSEINLMDQQVLEERLKHPEIRFTRADYIRRATLRALAADTPPKVRERRREAVRSSAAA